MIVAHDCENKQLKGPFSLNCSSDTQSQLLSASAGIDVRCRIISNPKKKEEEEARGMYIPSVFEHVRLCKPYTVMVFV